MAKKMNRTEYMKKLGKTLIEKVLGEKGIAVLWENPVNIPLIHPFNPVSKTIYSGVNEKILSLASMARMGDKFVDPRFFTLKQAIDKKIWPGERDKDGNYITVKGKDGREHVKTKKGKDGKSVMLGKGYPVFYFSHWLPKQERDEILKDKDLTDEQKKTAAFMSTKGFFRLYYVYNAADLEIEPLKKEEVELLQWSDKIRNKLLDNGIKNSEAKIKYDAISQTKGKNCYAPADDVIHLVKKTLFKSADAFYDTAFHEIAHSTGNEKRLGRKIANKFGTPAYAREELVAEMTATFFRMEFGGEVSERTMRNHEAYMDSWIHEVKDSPENFLAIISDAVKAFDYIEKHMIFKGMSEYEKENFIRLYQTGGKADYEKAKKDEGKELVKKHTKRAKKDSGMGSLFAA